MNIYLTIYIYIKLRKSEWITKVMSLVVLKVPGNKSIIINTKSLCSAGIRLDFSLIPALPLI